ncbi:MAG TPA: aminotransferase class I/II-fold pyridoxal phosphate-dependent enzyme [Ktedonobacteraceae bacterium]
MDKRQIGHIATGYVTKYLEIYDGRNGAEIDLGLAMSPIGFAHELRDLLENRDAFSSLCIYPIDPLHRETCQILIEGIGLQEVSTDAVLFIDNGSYGAGDEMMRFLSHLNYHEVLVSTYSFPNVVQWAKRHKILYTPLPTFLKDPLASLQEVLKMDKSGLYRRIVYIDYPNNPFGVANPEILRNIIDHVIECEGMPLVDLAFGEILGAEFKDAIQYTLIKGGIVIGSLSKTQGLPGLRTGYAILSQVLIEEKFLEGQRLVFGLHNEAEFIYQQLFKRSQGETLAQKHARRVASYNVKVNEKLMKELKQFGLHIGVTDLRTPIQVIISNDNQFYQKLAREGIKTTSLNDYSVSLANESGFSDSAVRMLTPKTEYLDEVLRRIRKALK